MTFNVGDTVRAVNVHTMHSGLEGKTGKVVGVSEIAQACRVHLKWEAHGVSAFEVQGVLTTLYFDELDLVESANEREQIEKMAQVLLEEGKFPSSSSALETAATLYKAGCRHES